MIGTMRPARCSTAHMTSSRTHSEACERGDITSRNHSADSRPSRIDLPQSSEDLMSFGEYHDAMPAESSAGSSTVSTKTLSADEWLMNTELVGIHIR